MDSYSVEVARFTRWDEAHIIKARLEHEGIRCALIDENVNLLYSHAVAVRLIVRRNQAQLANKLIHRFRHFSIVDQEDESA